MVNPRCERVWPTATRRIDMEASSKEKEFIRSQHAKEKEWISFDEGRICPSRIEVSNRAGMTDKREKSVVKQKVKEERMKEERMTEQRILVLKKKKEAGARIAYCFLCQAWQYCSEWLHVPKGDKVMAVKSSKKTERQSERRQRLEKREGTDADGCVFCIAFFGGSLFMESYW